MWKYIYEYKFGGVWEGQVRGGKGDQCFNNIEVHYVYVGSWHNETY
jgi:hypothetical protein